MDDREIRIGRTIDEAAKFVFGNLLAVVRVGWLPIVLTLSAVAAIVWVFWQPLILAYVEVFTSINDAVASGAASSDVEIDPAVLERAIEEIGVSGLLTGYFGVIVVALAGYAIPMTAYARMMVLDERYGGPFFIRFGAREANVALTYFALTLIIAIVMMILTTVMALAIAFTVGDQAGEAGAGLAVFLLIVVSVVAFIWLFARLGIALPASAVDGGVPIGRAWSLTRGIGGTLSWILVLGYLVLFALTMVFMMMVSMVTGIIFGILTSLGSQLAPYFIGTLIAVGYVLVYCFGTAFFMALFAGPYKRLTQAAPD